MRRTLRRFSSAKKLSGFITRLFPYAEIPNKSKVVPFSAVNETNLKIWKA
jgi:hypothetical protein